jgi:hypothetical protein
MSSVVRPLTLAIILAFAGAAIAAEPAKPAAKSAKPVAKPAAKAAQPVPSGCRWWSTASTRKPVVR